METQWKHKPTETVNLIENIQGANSGGITHTAGTNGCGQSLGTLEVAKTNYLIERALMT